MRRGRTKQGSARDLADFVRSNCISRVYLALPISTEPRIEELVRELRDTTASVYFVPNIFAFDLVQARYVEIGGMLAFSICDSPLQGISGLWKRMFDVTLASIALMLTWPVLLAIALAIKYSSAGPVLFKQRCYGLNGEEILVHKFRSMTVCERWSGGRPSNPASRPRHPAGRVLAPHIVGRIAADFEYTRRQDEFRRPQTACGGPQRSVSKADQRLHDSSQGASRYHRLGAGQ